MARGEVDAIATPDLATSYGYLPIVSIGFSDYYFAVSKSRPDLLQELNAALLYQNPDFDQNRPVISASEENMFPEEVVLLLYPEATLYPCESMEESLNAVASGKADCTLVTSVRMNVLRRYDAMNALQFADTAALETAEKEYAYRLYLDNSELEIKANQDALTKIGNRHYFFTKMGELLASHEELTVCYCDLDHMKAVNDRFGHEAGDGYLRGFVEAVGGHIRAGDIFARIGGDEFCMVFRRCGRDNAAKKVEQMQALFAAGSTADYPRSFRCGVLHVPENHGALDVLELLRQADALMYEEKKAHHAAGYQRA